MKCVVCLCTVNNEPIDTKRGWHCCSTDCEIEFKKTCCNGCSNTLNNEEYIEGNDEYRYCCLTREQQQYSCAQVYETLQYYKLSINKSWLNQNDFPSTLILQKLVEVKDKASTISKQINRNKKEQEKVTAERKMLQIVRRFVKGDEETSDNDSCEDKISVTCPTCHDEFNVYYVKWV